ncbi:MAG: hypothetical protein LR015_04250 [Verrucomicrobia bacterium]|nr:hypothetical protein [Verrucomicrobiota bacterium]
MKAPKTSNRNLTKELPMKLQLLAKLSPLAFILCSPLVGQTVYTDPVGAVSVSLAPGNQVLSIPFQKPVLFQGEITSVDGNSISLASLPSISGQAYVQVVSGASAGKIVSIESINASDVLLSAFSFSLSAGDIIQIRNHFTLDDLAALLNAGDGDSVSLLNPDGSRIIGEFWTGFGWEDTLTFDPIGDVVVYPGEGFLFNSVSGGQATLLGSVATHDVSFDLPGGNVISIIGNSHLFLAKHWVLSSLLLPMVIG